MSHQPPTAAPLSPDARQLPDQPVVDHLAIPPAPQMSSSPRHLEGSFTDGSGALFTMYNERAAEEDQKMTESWKGDADGILVFDASAFYLAQLYQLNAGSNTSVAIPSSLSDPSTFSPPVSAVWINALWSISLVLSLTYALLTTLLQQWARRYLRITQPRYSPHKRARTRELMAQGVEKLHLPQVVEALPAMLHVSVFIFFAGLVIFMFDINRTVFGAVALCVGICVGLYLCITLIPIFRADSPYNTPLSTLAWISCLGAMWLTLRSLLRLHLLPSARRFATHLLSLRLHQRLTKGLPNQVEESAWEDSHALDPRVLSRLFDFLDEDRELEMFMAGVSGFLDSIVVGDPRGVLEKSIEPNQFYLTIVSFLHRSLASDLAVESTRRRALAIWTKVLHRAPPFLLQGTLVSMAMYLDPGLFVHHNEFLNLVESRCIDSDHIVEYGARSMVACAIHHMQDEDERWPEMVKRRLGLSESRCRQYRSHGDNVRLLNIVDLAQYQLASGRIEPLLSVSDSSPWHARLLHMARMIDTATVEPELQHAFCSLWNELVFAMRTADMRQDRSKNAKRILNYLRSVYGPLHNDTKCALASSNPYFFDDPPLDETWYPLCTLSSHQLPVPLDLTTEILIAPSTEDA
ncbi:hypothetical protein BC834DRAFT_1032936 [Gloeopeniophorella convolvens]|nr:hypothetical protein BC834DRAFT_1032936 [Gloeopeniophorella convolvens]